MDKEPKPKRITLAALKAILHQQTAREIRRFTACKTWHNQSC